MEDDFKAEVIQWLLDGGEKSAAELLSICDLSLDFVDIVFQLPTYKEIALYDVTIAAPRKILDALKKKYANEVNQIEEAIKQVGSREQDASVNDIFWVAKISLRSRAVTEISMQLTEVNSAHIQQLWDKALERMATDPDGAITAARSLVETVCKYILDNAGVSYTDRDDLPKLYCLVMQYFNLTPEQYSSETIKRILGSSQAIVNGVAELRNKYGDAHGKGEKAIVPDTIMAELAINMAGSMAKYLLSMWESLKK